MLLSKYECWLAFTLGDAIGEGSVQKKKLTLSFEEYRTLSTMLIVHMRNEEIRTERDGKFLQV